MLRVLKDGVRSGVNFGFRDRRRVPRRGVRRRSVSAAHRPDLLPAMLTLLPWQRRRRLVSWSHRQVACHCPPFSGSTLGAVGIMPCIRRLEPTTAHRLRKAPALTVPALSRCVARRPREPGLWTAPPPCAVPHPAASSDLAPGSQLDPVHPL